MHEKAMVEKEEFLHQSEAKILSLEGNILDKSKKLNKVDNFTDEKISIATHYIEETEKAKTLTIFLQGQMSSLRNKWACYLS